MLVGSKLSQAPKIIIPTGLFAFHLHSFSLSHSFFTLQCHLLFKSFPNLPSDLKMKKYFGKSKFRILDPIKIGLFFSTYHHAKHGSSETCRLDASKF